LYPSAFSYVSGLRRQSIAKLHNLSIEAPITKVIALITSVQDNANVEDIQTLDKVHTLSFAAHWIVFRINRANDCSVFRIQGNRMRICWIYDLVIHIYFSSVMILGSVCLPKHMCFCVLYHYKLYCSSQ
jgi:hypothetical protein